MKFIAAKSFRVTPDMAIKTEKLENESHVPKGTAIEIGSGKTVRECSKKDQEILSILNYSGCLVAADDEKAVARIKEEVAIEESKSKTKKASDKGEPAK